MKPDAIHCQLHREGGRMRPLLRPPLDGFVGHKPGVAATTPVAPAGMTPTRDVGFVRIRHAERESVERRLPLRREMKDVFVTIVEEARRADRLEMAARNLTCALLVRQG